MPIEKRIRKGDTEWITDPILYLAEGKIKAKTDRTETDADRSGTSPKNNGRGSVKAGIEFPYKGRKIVRRILLTLIPETESKSKIEAFLKRENVHSRITVHGRMNLLCSFLYHLTDIGAIKAEMKELESVVLKEFKFLKINGVEVSQLSVKNVFKKGNEKKNISQVGTKTANKGARLPLPVVTKTIFNLMKGNDARDFKDQMEEWLKEYERQLKARKKLSEL